MAHFAAHFAAGGRRLATSSCHSPPPLLVLSAMSGLMYASSSNAGAGASSAYDYDPPSERVFVSFFRSLPASGPGLVRLFDRGAFYSAHGEDATRVADSVYRTRSVIKQLTGSNGVLLPSVTLNPAAAKSFLRDALSAKQMRVEVYTNGGGKRTANWAVSKQVRFPYISFLCL